MADFTLAQIGETSGSPVSPQPGVASGASNQALSFVHNVGSALFGQFAEQRKAQAEADMESQTNKAVSRFAQQQMHIADLVDQGRLSSQEARMRMRYNLTRASADNPDLYEAFADTHKQVVGTAGMGKVAAEGTEQEQAFFQAQRQATKDGWVVQGMSQEQAAQATAAWQQFNLEQQMIDAEQSAIALQRAEIGLVTDRIQQQSARVSLSTSQINLQQKREEQRARQHISSMADHYSVRLRTKFDTWQGAVERGELDAVEAARMMDEEWLTIQSTVAEAGRAADSSYLSNVVAPMERLYTMKRGYITGEIPADVMNEQTELAIAQQSAMIMANPDDVQVIATSRLVGQGGNVALVGPLTDVATRNIGKNRNPEGRPADLTDPGAQEGTDQYIGVLKNSIQRANRGSVLGGEATLEEIDTNINQVLKGVGIYGAAVDNPRDFNAVVNLIASDDYGEYVERHGTRIQRENAGNARAILEEKFDAVVRPLIAQEWRNAEELTYELFDPTRPFGNLGYGAVGIQTTNMGVTRPTPSIIRPFFDGNSVRFVISDDSASDNPRVQQKLNDLNSRVAPVMQRLIKMGAHLEGHRDYQRVYEGNYAQLFGDAGTGQQD